MFDAFGNCDRSRDCASARHCNFGSCGGLTSIESVCEDFSHDAGQRLIRQIPDFHPTRTLRCCRCWLCVRDEDSQFEREMSEYVPHHAGQLAPSRSPT
jgi:hypothetical protein